MFDAIHLFVGFLCPFYRRMKYVHGDWFIGDAKWRTEPLKWFSSLTAPALYTLRLMLIHHVNCICEYCTNAVRLMTNAMFVRLTTNGLFRVLYSPVGNCGWQQWCRQRMNYFAISRPWRGPRNGLLCTKSVVLRENFVKYCSFLIYLHILSFFWYFWEHFQLPGILLDIFTRANCSYFPLDW